MAILHSLRNINTRNHCLLVDDIMCKLWLSKLHSRRLKDVRDIIHHSLKYTGYLQFKIRQTQFKFWTQNIKIANHVSSKTVQSQDWLTELFIYYCNLCHVWFRLVKEKCGWNKKKKEWKIKTRLLSPNVTQGGRFFLVTMRNFKINFQGNFFGHFDVLWNQKNLMSNVSTLSINFRPMLS